MATGKHLFPFRTEKLSPLSADGTWRATSWESRSPPDYFFRGGVAPAPTRSDAVGNSSCVRPATPREAVRASPGRGRAGARRARRSGGCVGTTSRASRPERVDHVDGLRGRDWPGIDRAPSPARVARARRRARAATRRSQPRAHPRRTRASATTSPARGLRPPARERTRRPRWKKPPIRLASRSQTARTTIGV